MKIYKNKEEVLKDVRNGKLVIMDDVEFKFNLDLNNIDITAQNITAQNITAQNITAQDITAQDIVYYAVCFAYKNIDCKNIRGTRKNSKHFVLDGKLKIK